MAEKCFNFTIEVTEYMSGYVFAENEEEARKKISNCEWDEATYNERPIVKGFEDLEEDTGRVED